MSLGNIENIDELMAASADLTRENEIAQGRMLELKKWINSFDPADPPTPSQIAFQVAKLKLGKVAAAYAAAGVIYDAEDPIPDLETVE